jgi:hypothetical protein
MKQFYCTICRNPAEVVATTLQPGEFGPTRLINLECPTCPEHISCTVELPALTALEQYRLGMAVGSFSVGEFDQGIHCILPVYDPEQGDHENEIFQELIDMIELIKKPCDGDAYIGACQKFGIDMGIEGMPDHCVTAYEDSIK